MSTSVFLHILFMILVHFLNLVMFTFRFVLIVSSQCYSQVTVYMFYVWLFNVVDICAISFVSSATTVHHSVRAWARIVEIDWLSKLWEPIHHMSFEANNTKVAMCLKVVRLTVKGTGLWRCLLPQFLLFTSPYHISIAVVSIYPVWLGLSHHSYLIACHMKSFVFCHCGSTRDQYCQERVRHVYMWGVTN